jgi:hypothetical protein
VNNFRTPRLEFVIGALLTLVVCALLIARTVYAGPLWRDEAAALQLAQLPTLGEVAANFQHEAFPLPFSLTVRIYTALFGTTDLSLRCFGLVVGLATVVIAWFISRALGGRGPLLFLALFGLNRTFLTWGTSLRGYGLGSAFLLLTLGLAAAAIHQPGRRNAFAATIVAIASVQFMLNALPLVAAIAAAAALVFVFQRNLRRAVAVLICAAICVGTFLPYVASYATADWTVVLKFPVTVASLWEKLRVALGPGLMELLWYVVVPLLVISAAWRLWSSRADRLSTQNQVLQFLIAGTLLSIASYYAFLQMLSYATRPWYYLPLLCVIAGAVDLIGTALTEVRWVHIGRLLLTTAALLILPFTSWSHVSERLTNIDIVAQKLEAEAAPNDLIVVNPWHFAPSFYRYYHGSTPWITVPIINEHRFHRYDLMKARMMELDPLSDVRAAIRATLQSYHRVWIVGGARPPEENIPATLGPAPNPQLGWAGYMSFWSIELGSFLNAHAVAGDVVIEPMPGVNEAENVPLLVARGWRD